MIYNFQIVVARYNENLDWLKKYKNISLVYNKGNNDVELNDFNVINLPNFGRESHTYLYHIINNYDNLKEYTIFFQGSLDFAKDIKHNKLNIEDYFQLNDFNGTLQSCSFEQLKYPIQHFGKWKIEYDNGLMKKSNFSCCYTWLKNFLEFDEIDLEYIDVAWGAMFSVHKSIILKKPKIFYEHLLRFIDYHPNPEEGHYFERSWYFIFTNNYLNKPIIKIHKLKDMENIEIDNIIYKHYWVNLNDYHKFHNFILDFIIFPDYYFQLYQNNFYLKFEDIFYIKIKINEQFYFHILLSKKLEFHLILLNSTIIEKVKYNLLPSYNHFNFVVHDYILKIYLNKDLFFSYELNSDNIYHLDNIQLFVKTNNYNNNITLDNNNHSKIKFLLLKNTYFETKMFYQKYFLNYYIDYSNY